MNKDITSIQVKKLDQNATIPTRTLRSAGYDLYSIETGIIPPNGGYKIFHTGIAMKVPDGYCGKIFSRSGLSCKYNLEHGAGVIDEDYTGEIMVKVNNFGKEEYTVNVGDRIAQIVLFKCLQVSMIEVSSLDETERGTNGFGSSGK